MKFVGDCYDMAAAYSVADIVISPSLDPEPFGRTIIEAQAMGNLVLASNHGGAVESIVEGKTGWLFEPRNSAALSDSLKNALSLTEQKRSTISSNAQKHIKEKFSTQLMCMRTLSVYSEILNLTQQFFKLKNPLERIEGYDNSFYSNNYAVASYIVFNNRFEL